MVISTKRNEKLIIGIDASRNRSGGAKAHLKGILSEGDPLKHGIHEVHLWAFSSLLDSIPEYPWLFKHNPKELDRSLTIQLWWQAFRLSAEVFSAGCDILFTTGASTLCRFNPMVVMSQDMLSYEPGVMQYFGYTKARLRLLAILQLQNRAFRFADGVIFLTKYAANTIQLSCGALSRITHIPHGVGVEFKYTKTQRVWPMGAEHPIQCLYVSNAAMHKHQWVVIRAVAGLRKRGHNLSLTLIGGGSGRAQKLLERQLSVSDPEGAFIEQLDFVPHKELPSHLAKANVFVFASSCENMPVTLVEAMAAGLPIACSNRGPMSEILEDGGIYFDPEDADSIARAIEQIIKNKALREMVLQRAQNLSERYSWERCSNETWKFIVDTYNCIKT